MIFIAKSDTLLQILCLYFRPPDRRRRDLFGLANNTQFHDSGQGNTTFGSVDNSTDGIPAVIEYPFHENKTSAESLEIPGLLPFTLYLIEIHACNKELGNNCSIGAFVFSRTKPAGEEKTVSSASLKM